MDVHSADDTEHRHPHAVTMGGGGSGVVLPRDGEGERCKVLTRISSTDHTLFPFSGEPPTLLLIITHPHHWVVLHIVTGLLILQKITNINRLRCY